MDGSGALNSQFPNPGPNYKIWERLGGGVWKVAYRASTTSGLRDVALLYFHDRKRIDEFIKELSNLLRVSQHRYSAYVAEILGYNKGLDGQSFIIEELIVRPLDALAPMRDIVRFSKIARDLSRGLCCIHENGLVHRDLKLDNCGIDNSDRAKIFDLGSLTSDPGETTATILTRAPELFNSEARPLFNKEADIWALGATLFALRTGEYPFVHRSEVEERRGVNWQFVAGEISLDEAIKRKAHVDRNVGSRIGGAEAEAGLLSRIYATFRNKAEELIRGTLSFDPKQRPTVQVLLDEWSALANWSEGARVEREARPTNVAIQLEKLLDACVAGEISLTSMQIDRLHQSFLDAKLEGEVAARIGELFVGAKRQLTEVGSTA